MNYPEANQLKTLLDESKTILVIQAENPDGDSVSTSLALEAILHELGKEPILYCAVSVPRHLRHMPGWDRITSDLPLNFDAAILVDAAGTALLESTMKQPNAAKLRQRPFMIIDHHGESKPADFASIILIDDSAVATGQIVYELAQQLDWPLNQEAKERLASSIMYDSLGLASVGTTARTIHIIADLVEQGVSLAKLDEERRAAMRRSSELTNYKGRLLQRIEYLGENGRIAIIDIPWEEIEKYSDQYNPPMLVIDDMRLTEGVELAIAFKSYPDGRITAKIRTNPGGEIADQLAAKFGGGGHRYAAGFKVRDKSLEDVKQATIAAAEELLNKREATE